MIGVLLASWMGGGIGFALSGNAQVQPSVKNSDIDAQPVAKVDIGKILKDIGHRVTRHTAEEPKVDVVFVIDASQRMSGTLEEINEKLVEMLDAIEEKTLDYRFALIEFRLVKGRSEIKLVPWSFDRAAFQDQLRYMRDGDFNAGYGLDALMQGLDEFKFQVYIPTQFVVITNTPLRTVRSGIELKKRIVGEIISSCRRDNVQLNFIGVRDSVQVQLANQTGGDWYSIDGDEREVRSGVPRPLPLEEPSALSAEEIREARRNASDRSGTAPKPADQIANEFSLRGKRSGFFWGGGVGFGMTNYTQILVDYWGNAYEGAHPEARATTSAFVTDIKIGHGFSDQFMLYYTSRVAWMPLHKLYRDTMIANGTAGIGITFFLKDRSNLYLSGSLGLATLATWFPPFELENARATGFAVSAGIGYEFMPHYTVDITLRFGNASSIAYDSVNRIDLTNEVVTVLVTFNGIAY